MHIGLQLTASVIVIRNVRLVWQAIWYHTAARRLAWSSGRGRRQSSALKVQYRWGRCDEASCTLDTRRPEIARTDAAPSWQKRCAQLAEERRGPWVTVPSGGHCGDPIQHRPETVHKCKHLHIHQTTVRNFTATLQYYARLRLCAFNSLTKKASMMKVGLFYTPTVTQMSTEG